MLRKKTQPQHYAIQGVALSLKIAAAGAWDPSEQMVPMRQ